MADKEVDSDGPSSYLDMGPKKKSGTPIKQKDDSFRMDETFSPVSGKGVADSPGLKQGNLTGTARKIKDSAADLHNLMQKWNILNVDGSNIIAEIANIKLEPKENEDSTALPETLLPLCDQLTQLLTKMEKLCTRLSGMVETMNGVIQLERYKQTDGEHRVLFQTWDVTKFGEVFQEVSTMIQKELELKKCIASNVCHGKTRDVIMFYSAAWLHQPYIDDHCELLIDSLLLETKHKT